MSLHISRNELLSMLPLVASDLDRARLIFFRLCDLPQNDPEHELLQQALNKFSKDVVTRCFVDHWKSVKWD